MTHQELFNRWYNAEVANIWERSSTIAENIRKLQEEAKEYAKANGLQLNESMTEDE